MKIHVIAVFGFALFLAVCRAVPLMASAELASSKGPVKLTVTLTPNPGQIGDPIWLTIKLANASGNDMTFVHMNEFAEFNIKIFDLAAQEVPFTQLGNKSALNDGARDMDFLKLGAGQSREWKLELKKFYQLKIGLYRLNVSLGLNLHKIPVSGNQAPTGVDWWPIPISMATDDISVHDLKLSVVK
jgi:hypothetical protein